MITLADQVTGYRQRVHKALDAIMVSEVAGIVNLLRDIKEHGGTVYVIGNGGSKANAQHLVLHLRDAGIKAFDLMGDTAWLTARSNDDDYHTAHLRLLSLLEGGSNALWVLSGSGASKNILAALTGFEGTKVGLLGSNGGKAGQYCHVAVRLPQTEYGPVEDAHSAVIHIVHEALQ